MAPPPPPQTTMSSSSNNVNEDEEDTMKTGSTDVNHVVVAYALLNDDDENGFRRPTAFSSSSSSALYLPYHYRTGTGDGVHSTTPTTTTVDHDIVSQWYEHYAHMYPSLQYIKLQQQRQQREQHQEMHEKSSKKAGWIGLSSFIGKWMSGSSSSSSSAAVLPNLEEGNGDYSDGDDNYHEKDFDQHGNSKSTCPPKKSDYKILDEAIIIPPREATSFHRFHLVSERRALSIPQLVQPQPCGYDGNNNMSAFAVDPNRHNDDRNINNINHNNGWNNVVIPVRPCMMGRRTAANTKETNTTRPIPYYCIVGYGQIAEFDSSMSSSSSSLYNDSSSSSGQCDDQERGNDNFSSTSAIESKILLTSDWQQHLSNSSSLPSSLLLSRTHNVRHDPRYIRAASIGRNCLIVSWGMPREEDNAGDEIIFYRKLSHPQQQQQRLRQDVSAVSMTTTTMATPPIIGWEAVAVASPSDMVVRDAIRNSTPPPTSDEKVAETKEVDEDQSSRRRLRDCRSLIVTDLIPISIGNDIVLAISRLGGFVELLPVPSWVCGETPMNSSLSYSSGTSATTTKRRWRQKDKTTTKDTTSQLPNLAASSKISAFSTAQYHSDVVSMDAYVCVESTNAVRNKSHRVEVILAVCGRRKRHCIREDEVSAAHTAASTVVSLWGLSVDRHHHNPTQQQPSTPTFPIIFRVNRLGRATLENVGADVSSFLSDTAVERWATNRRNNDEDNDTNFNDYDPPPSKRRKKNTLREQTSFSTTTAVVVTATAPIVSLRFTPPCQNLVDDMTCDKSIDRVLLAALDYNGGVSVFDCTEACENNIDDADNLPLDGDVLFGASSNASSSLDEGVDMMNIRLLCSREIMMSIPSGGSHAKYKSHGMKLACASQIEWWPQHDVHGESSFTLTTYATMIQSRQNFSKIRRKSIVRLQRWSLSTEGCSKRRALEGPEDLFYVAMSSNNSIESSISLLPLASQHLSVLDDEAQPFLQLSAVLSPAPSSPSYRSLIRLRLSVCTIRKVTDPTEVIAALLRRGNAPKALDVARRFGFGAAKGRYRGDERLMNECQIDLWNTKRDPQALKRVTDDEYMIRQALELANDKICQNSLSLNDLIEIFREALARCEDRGDDKEDSAGQLRNIIRRLGTYNLVLNHVTAAAAATAGLLCEDRTHSRRFLRIFNLEALYDIAACAASKGDTKTLTVIIARHPFSLHERMGLLDLIPFEVRIRLYQHLMPCYNENMKREDALFLFKTGEDNRKFLSRLEFFARLSEMQLDRRQNTKNSEEEFPIDVFTDETDRYHVMQHLEGASSSDPGTVAAPMLKEEIINWYLKRALQVYNETGLVLFVKELCAAGLVRTGLDKFPDDGGFEILDMHNVSSSIAAGRLVYLYSASSLLCLISSGKIKDLISHGQLSIEFIAEWKERPLLSLFQLCSMETSDLFHFILENGSTHSIPLIQKYVAHLIDGSHCLEPMNNGTVKCSIKNIDLAEKFEHDMTQLCLEKLKGLRRIRDANFAAGQDSHHLAVRLEESLAMCANFISFGLLISESYRDRNKDSPIVLVDCIFRATLEVINGDWDLMTGSVIGKLWSVFELASYTSSNESHITSQDLSVLHFKLVTLQLCNKWHDYQTFPRDLLRDNHGIRELCVMGLGVISFVCSGFCEMVARMSTPRDDGQDPKQQFDLLFDFVSDVDEFDNRFFSAAIQQSGCLTKHIFSPLLYQQSFLMLHNLLKVRESWFNHDFMRSIVSSFVQNVGTSQDGVLEMWRILGQWFPDLRVEVEYHQRMLDAKAFMASAMNSEEDLLTRLFSIHHSATELLHTLLSINPQVILLGCEFWSDEVDSCTACTDAASYFAYEIHASLNGTSTEESIHVLPPMPGALIMQLANILGLHTSHELLAVKRYMVEGALKMSLVSAAAAICYSMLCDAAFSRRGNTACDPVIWRSWHESQVLDCVVALASDQSFLDFSVKKGMCTFALGLCATANSHMYLDIFDELRCAEYGVLATTAIYRDQCGVNRGANMDEASDFSLFQAAELVAQEFMDDAHNSSGTRVSGCKNNFFDRSLNSVFHDIKVSYQIDLLHGFAFTGKRSVDKNETTTEKIGDAIFQWIISEAFRARIGSVSTILQLANIEMMLDLGLSCLLECHEHETSRILSQTSNNFKSKAALFMNRQRTSPSPSFQPDQSIVQRLMDRGYTRNAARRAVLMTSNQSYSAALTWAVSHFQDANFDSPIYFLRSEDPRADQYLIDLVDKLLRTVQRIVKEKLPHSKGNKTPAATASVTKSSSHCTSIAPQERFASKVSIPTSHASPISFQDNSTALTGQLVREGKSAAGTSAMAATTVISEQIHHSTVALKKPLVSKLPSPSTIQECHPFPTIGRVGEQTTRRVGERSIVETPSPAIKIDRSFLSKPPSHMPNSTDSSSVEGSLSSRASIKNQIQRGMTKFGTQKLNAEERNRLALEGRRILEEARARGRIVIAPPTEITTTLSSRDVSNKMK